MTGHINDTLVPGIHISSCVCTRFTFSGLVLHFFSCRLSTGGLAKDDHSIVLSLRRGTSASHTILRDTLPNVIGRSPMLCILTKSILIFRDQPESIRISSFSSHWERPWMLPSSNGRASLIIEMKLTLDSLQLSRRLARSPGSFWGILGCNGIMSSV